MSKRKVKILHCIESIGSGGVEQRRLSISRYLDKDTFEQTLVCAKVKGDFDARLKAMGTEVYALGPMQHPFNWRYYKKLFQVIKQVKPDIIHGAVFEGVISAVVGGLFYRVPVVIVEETSEPENRSWRGNLLMRFLCLFAHTVVATSPAVYAYLTVKLKLSKQKVKLILNGAEPPVPVLGSVIDALKLSWQIQQHDFVIGFVGRLFNDVKQVTVLIAAIAEVIQQHPMANIKLLVVGDGPDREMLEAYAREKGIADKTLFTGYQRDTAPYYQMMNAFALISAHEGFGMAAVEAMFYGLPVIGTGVGGIKAIVDDGNTGFLVPIKAVKETAHAIQILYEHQDRAKQMGADGRIRALEKFTAERYAKEVEALYQSHITAL